MSVQNVTVAAAPAAAATPAAKLDGAAAAFGVSVSLAILFNTALVAVADSFPALDAYATTWTGGVWRTHALADVLVFLLIGFALMRRRFTIGGRALAFLLFCSVVVSVAGLGFWVARV